MKGAVLIYFRKYLWIAIAFVLASLFFAHPDLQHTVSSSYALYSNPVSEFYEVNRERVGGNDYLLTIYVIFAVWMLPLKLLGATTEDALPGNYQLSLVEIIWAKAFLLVALVILQALLDKILLHFKTELWHGRLLVSPVIVWVTLVVGQYDVIWILMLAAGCLSLLSGRTLAAGVLFGLSVSIKYFSFVFLFPLFLLLLFTSRKNWPMTIVSAATFALVLFSSLQDSKTLANVTRIPAKLVSEISSSILIWTGVVVLLGIAVFIALFQILIRNRFGDSTGTLLITSAVVALISYPVLFTLLRWNPQWLQIIVVLVLMMAPTAWRKWTNLWEFSGLGLLLLTAITFWPRNLDSFMLTESQLLQAANQVNSDWMSSTLIPSLSWVIIPMQLWVAIPAIATFLAALVWLKRRRLEFR
jgi:hypothetical protein